uniref:Putative lipocalin-3 1 n=1 Tax=Amblyomma parvum TaxID=251391 RepID=A0A023G2L8_AMBPA
MLPLSAVVIFSILMVEVYSAQTPPTSGAEKATIYNISEFLNTPEPIWTYNTTENANITCKVDKLYNLTSSTIYFNRSYYYNGSKTEYTVQGTFSQNSSDTMLIGMPGGPAEGSEVLLYEDEQNKCGVISVTITFGGPPNLNWFDLRVWNSSVESGPSEKCREYYNNYTSASSSKQIYTPDCQNIFTVNTTSTTPLYKTRSRKSLWQTLVSAVATTIHKGLSWLKG